MAEQEIYRKTELDGLQTRTHLVGTNATSPRRFNTVSIVQHTRR